MCTICGYTADDFWASFAIDQNGPLSPPAVRAIRARCLCDWVQRATQAVVAARDQGEQGGQGDQSPPRAARVTLDIGAGTEAAAGFFSGARIKGSARGYTVSSATGAMRFCSSLHAVVSHIKTRSPELCHVLHCQWPSEHRKMDWASWGAAWTWNAIMNDQPHPLPERVELADGRWLSFEPLPDDKLRVSLDTVEMAA